MGLLVLVYAKMDYSKVLPRVALSPNQNMSKSYGCAETTEPTVGLYLYLYLELIDICDKQAYNI